MRALARIRRWLHDHWKRLLLDGADYARWRGVRVGRNTQVMTRDLGGEPFLISIGSDCIIAPGVQFVNHDGASTLCIDAGGRRHRMQRISIGDRTFIGIRAIILPGVSIGDDVIVGAGSVLARSVPSGWVVAGNPARHIGFFDDYRSRALLHFVSNEGLPPNGSYQDWVAAATTEGRVKPLTSNLVRRTDAPPHRPSLDVD